MFKLWQWLLRLLALGALAIAAAWFTGQFQVPDWLTPIVKWPAIAGACLLALAYVVTEFLATEVPPEEVLQGLQEGRTPPAAATPGPAAPPSRKAPRLDPTELMMKVLTLSAKGKHRAVLEALPPAADLDPVLSSLPPADRAKVLGAAAKAYYEGGQLDQAGLRAKEARQLKPDNALAREVLCRVALATPAQQLRLDDLYPVYRELLGSWQDDLAPLVLHGLEAALARPTVSQRLVTQVAELVVAFRRIESVVEPFLERVRTVALSDRSRADFLAVACRCRDAQGHKKEALAVAGEALGFAAECPAILRYLIDHHRQAGTLAELVTTLTRLEMDHPRNPTIQQAQVEVGEALEQALREAEKRQDASMTPLELGMARLAAGRHAQAVEPLQEAVRQARADQSVLSRFLLAKAFLSTHQARPALDVLDQIDLRQLTLEQRFDLATLLESCNELQQARRLYSSVAAADRGFRNLEECLARVDAALSQSPQQKIEEDLVSAMPPRYSNVRQLGRGGMGIVFGAQDSESGRRVAIKVLSPILQTDVEALKRFLREAKTLASLRHPGIVEIFEISEKPLPFYSMELLAGKTLGEHLQASGALPVPQAASLLSRAAEALAYCHSQGCIHRDIKPSNIFLHEDGRVLLIDFGLVHATGGTALTRTGTMMGTPAYMSPEQLSAAPVTQATDLYALGVSFYECVTGRLPFDGDDLVGQVMFKQPTPPRVHRPDLTEAAEAVILKCLEKQAARRYADAGQLAEALRRLA